MKVSTVGRVFCLGVCVVLISACSINRMVTRRISDVLAADAGANVFTTDDDPELVQGAMPFVLKLYDALIEQDPDNRDLLLGAAGAYVSYAHAFLHTPAGMLPPGQFERRERMLARAKGLYLRGRSLGLRGLATRYGGFLEPAGGEDITAALDQTGAADVALLYWTAAGWVGAIATDPFDLDLSLSMPTAARLMDRAFQLEPDFDDGAIHEFYVSYYAALPEGRGGGRDRARRHFADALRLAAGRKSSPYVTLATAVSIPEQNLDEFVTLVEQALAVDPDAAPEYRLVNTLKQEEARWYLANLGRFFIDADPAADDWNGDWDEIPRAE